MMSAITTIQALVSVIFLALLGVQELMLAHQSYVALQVGRRLEPWVNRLGAAFVITVLWRLHVLSS